MPSIWLDMPELLKVEDHFSTVSFSGGAKAQVAFICNTFWYQRCVGILKCQASLASL